MVWKIRAKLVLQLRAQGMSGRTMASSQSISRNSVAGVLEAATTTGISWEDIQDKPENAVYELLFPGRSEHHSVLPSRTGPRCTNSWQS